MQKNMLYHLGHTHYNFFTWTCMLENLTKNGCYSFSPKPLNHCLLCSGFAFSYLAIFIHSLFSQQKNRRILSKVLCCCPAFAFVLD